MAPISRQQQEPEEEEEEEEVEEEEEEEQVPIGPFRVGLAPPCGVHLRLIYHPETRLIFFFFLLHLEGGKGRDRDRERKRDESWEYKNEYSISPSCGGVGLHLFHESTCLFYGCPIL